MRGNAGATSFMLAWLSPKEWSKLLERAGFQVLGCYGWFDRRPYTGGEDTRLGRAAPALTRTATSGVRPWTCPFRTRARLEEGLDELDLVADGDFA